MDEVRMTTQRGFDMKRVLALMVLSMFSLGMLSGCNTMAGAGKDVQKAGEKVEDKAKDCKDGRC
jgi:predicted small secreted protein